MMSYSFLWLSFLRTFDVLPVMWYHHAQRGRCYLPAHSRMMSQSFCRWLNLIDPVGFNHLSLSSDSCRTSVAASGRLGNIFVHNYMIHLDEDLLERKLTRHEAPCYHVSLQNLWLLIEGFIHPCNIPCSMPYLMFRIDSSRLTVRCSGQGG